MFFWLLWKSGLPLVNRVGSNMTKEVFNGSAPVFPTLSSCRFIPPVIFRFAVNLRMAAKSCNNIRNFRISNKLATNFQRAEPLPSHCFREFCDLIEI